MNQQAIKQRGQWSSRMAFIFAATGSAVGLGNIWKFPYMAGENGGGSFVLMYLMCIALVGIPIMMAEILIGRHGAQNPISTMKDVAIEAGRSKHWQLVGWMGAFAGFLILSFYSVVAGWAMAYVVDFASGAFDGKSVEDAGQVFAELTQDPKKMFLWHTIFMAVTMYVVSRGVTAGIERAAKILMPSLFVLLVVLMIYAAKAGDFYAGLKFLFNLDTSQMSGQSVLEALGHAFFTLSLGMCAIMVYGSYLSKDISITKISFTIAILDTLVALVAGMVIFPIVFANEALSAGAGPGLLFQTLPVAFASMPAGTLFGTLFFILVVFAGLTSSISLLEPAVSYVSEKSSLSRRQSTLVIGLAIWALGIACLLSMNVWSAYTITDKNIFDFLAHVSLNIMLPLGGLLVALFVGWVMPMHLTAGELQMRSGYRLWLVIVKYLSPIAVVIVFANSVGLLSWFD